LCIILDFCTSAKLRPDRIAARQLAGPAACWLKPAPRTIAGSGLPWLLSEKAAAATDIIWRLLMTHSLPPNANSSLEMALLEQLAFTQ
jgi:hypothetical protein